MATKKSTKKQSGKKSASAKKGVGKATKKQGRIKQPRLTSKDIPFEQLPPIVVGGGGSTYVWIRTDFTLYAQTQDYIIYRLGRNVTSIDVDEGTGGHQHRHGLRPDHYTEFDE